MANIKLQAVSRKVFGRKVKSLRKEGILPANIYGKKIKSTSVQIDLKEFEKVYKEAGETSLIDLVVDKKVHPVLVSDIQVNPVDSSFYHVDFKEVDLKEKVSAQVPVEVVGESPAEKQGLGILVQLVEEVEVEALPTDLPEKFEVDVSKLEEVDASIHIKDIKSGDKVEILDDAEQIVVKIDALREEEVEEEPVATEAEGQDAEASVEGESKEGDKEQEAEDKKE